MVTDAEVWRPLPGYEGRYDVSSHGRVRSLGVKARILKPGFAKSYEKVTLYREGKKRDVTVHRLVCRTFHGDRDGVIRHLDGNHLNNRADNLCWGSPAENAKDRDAHGTTARGVRQGLARHNEDDIRAMRSLRDQGLTLQAIGDFYGISRARVHEIVRFRTWKHVP